MIKQYTHQEILKMVPGSWAEVTLDKYLNHIMYLKQIDTEVIDAYDAMDKGLEMASIFIGLPADILRKFPLETVKDINLKLMFLYEKPKPLEKTKYRWLKKLDHPSFDTFITYTKISEQLSNNDFSNFPLLIKSICLDPITDEEVMNLPADEVETAFFFLRKSLINYIEPSINKLTTDLLIQAYKTRLKRLLKIV